MAPKQAAGKISRAKPQVQRPARQAAPPKSKSSSSGKETISSPGKAPITFAKGGLHRSLGVPPSQPIPSGKMADAIAGKYGAAAAKQANFAKNVLGKGRKTAAKNKKG
jgi:hypothetical protein